LTVATFEGLPFAVAEEGTGVLSRDSTGKYGRLEYSSRDGSCLRGHGGSGEPWNGMSGRIANGRPIPLQPLMTDCISVSCLN
jgi:hypothetical protein